MGYNGTFVQEAQMSSKTIGTISPGIGEVFRTQKHNKLAVEDSSKLLLLLVCRLAGAWFLNSWGSK